MSQGDPPGPLEVWTTCRESLTVMDWPLLMKSMLIGFSIAAPVGPIGVLCIRRTLAQGAAAGLLTGLGAATADAFYGAVAAFGLTAVSAWLLDHQFWLRLLGGSFLLGLGLKTILSRPVARNGADKGAPAVTDWASTFLLTLSNPLTIISFAAVYAGLGLVQPGRDWPAACLMVAGVFAGSAFWWVILSGGTNLVRGRVTPNWLKWINRLSGLVIMAFGLAALISL
ncbi:MAG: LysE family transporter [Thermodesulfobacteriota bacterium]